MTTPGSPYVLVTPTNPWTPLDFGLASVITWQTMTVDGPIGPDGLPQQTVDERWIGGIRYEAFCASGNTTVSPCITGDVIDVPPKAATWERQTRGARSFTVYSEIDCSPVGFWERAQELAALGLTQAEAYQMERTFQTGTAATVPNLILPNLTTTGEIFDPIDARVLLQPASTTVTGAVLDIVEALGRLEAAMADCYAGGRGVIHVPVQVANAMAAQHLVTARGTQLRTTIGNLVAVGAGYLPNLGPGGVTAAAGTGWMYATGTMFGYRSGLKLVGTNRESLDRANNTLKRIAERHFVIGWDCCLLAIAVTLGGEGAGVYNSDTAA